MLSCDNMTGNGGVARGRVLAAAERLDADLRSWIAQHCSFSDSLES